jgi:hypothetical protein
MLGECPSGQRPVPCVDDYPKRPWRISDVRYSQLTLTVPSAAVTTEAGPPSPGAPL